MLQAFKNLKIKNKILCINGILVLALILLSALAIFNINVLSGKLVTVNEHWLPAVRYANEVKNLYMERRITSYRHIAEHSPEKMVIIEQELKTLKEKIDKGLQSYEPLATGKEEQARLADLKSVLPLYRSEMEKALQLSRKNQNEEALQLLQYGPSNKFFERIKGNLAQLVQLHVATAEQEKKQSLETAQFAQTIIVISVLVLTAIAAFLSFWLAGLISNPLSAVTQLAISIAGGNLRQKPLSLQTKDELGELSHALDTMVGNLHGIINNIKDNAASVASSSEELSATSTQMRQTASTMSNVSSDAFTVTEELDINIKTVAAAVEQSNANVQEIVKASGQVEKNINVVDDAALQVSANLQTISSASEEMSASINMVASAMEEMTSSLNEVSEQAGQAARIAGKADETAIATQTIMTGLDNSAKEIGNIVDMIKGIASQTNLLALNATIEAASAGEAGKGFAVVANEVKELAKQSAEATEEIRQRIDGIQQSTNSAVEAILEITRIIGEINEINHTIASAVEQQTATASEISQNVNGAAQASADVSKNVTNAATVAENVTRQTKEANSNIIDITRNLQEVSKGSNEISKSAGEAASRATRMSKNIQNVSTSSTEAEQGASDVQVTSAELAKLAAKLEEAVKQFAL